MFVVDLVCMCLKVIVICCLFEVVEMCMVELFDLLLNYEDCKMMCE